jgi:hypothetical protein
MTLAHQNLAQLGKDPELQDAILGTCLVKVIFGGMSYDSASFMAQEVMLGKVNERMIDETFEHLETTDYAVRSIPTESRTVTVGQGSSQGAASSKGLSTGQADRLAVVGHEEFEQVGLTESENSIEGRSQSESASSTISRSIQHGTAYFLVPEHTRAVTGRATRSRDEKVSIYAQQLIEQPKQHATVRLRNTTFEAVIPDVKNLTPGPEAIKDYEIAQYKRQGALPAAEVDALLIQSEKEFLERVAGHQLEERRAISVRPSKKKQKPEAPLTAKTKPTI